MIRRAAAYAVAAGIGSAVGTVTGVALGAAVAYILMTDKDTRTVVNNYHDNNVKDNEDLQPQDAVLENVDLSTQPSE